MFGKPTRVIPKTSLSKKTDDLRTTPSEKTTIAQNEVLTNEEHVNIHEVSTTTSDWSCDSHVNSDDEIFAKSNISCESHVDSDDDSTTTSSSVEDLPTAIHQSPCLTTTTPINPLTASPQVETDLKHSLSFDSWDSLFDDKSCDEDFPDEFFLFPTDCGNIGFMLGPDDWEKIEPEQHLSQENLNTDDEGTTSTGMKSGQVYDVVGDGDSKATSRNYCDSPVPMEMVSGMSCDGSDEDLVITSSDHDELPEESLEYGDFDNGSCNGFDSGDECVDISLDDCDMISEGNDRYGFFRVCIWS